MKTSAVKNGLRESEVDRGDEVRMEGEEGG